MMTASTNAYVPIYQARKRKKDPTCSTDMIKAYIGIRMLMAIDPKPSLADYWSTNPSLKNERIAATMSRDRFVNIQRYFHINDPNKDPTRMSGEKAEEARKRNPLYKVSPLMEGVRHNSKRLYNLHQQVSVDEAMIKCHGQHWGIVGAPNKPAKRGFKIFVLADAVTGYMSDFMVYLRKQKEVGLPSPETQMILLAIASSTDRMSKEINDVKTEVVSIQRDLKGVKHEVEKLKKSVLSVETKCSDYDDKLKRIEGSIDQINYNEEVLQSDIDALDSRTGQHGDNIDFLEDKIDRLENELIKNNLRIFGIDEADHETDVQTKSIISEKVLSVVYPNGDHDISSIESARRVGKPQSEQTRMILVKFRTFYDKLKVLEAREVLRNKGIRVSNELTSKQRQILKSKNDQGIKGYFKDGKFCEFPRSNTGGARIYRRGQRQGDRVVSSVEFHPTVQIGVGRSDMEQEEHVRSDNTNLPPNRNR